MAQWISFSADHDHEWPSRAVTAFKAGMTVFVKDEVAAGALKAGKAVSAEKPADGDESHVTTPSALESGGAGAYTAGDEVSADNADGRPVDGLAERDDAPDVGAVVPVPADASPRKRRRARKR